MPQRPEDSQVEPSTHTSTSTVSAKKYVRERAEVSLQLDRRVFFDKDTIRGTCTVYAHRTLRVKRLAVRLRGTLAVGRFDDEPTKMVVREVECVLEKMMKFDANHNKGRYEYPFEFAYDKTLPNTVHYLESSAEGEHVSLNWSLVAVVMVKEAEEAHLCPVRIIKGASYGAKKQAKLPATHSASSGLLGSVLGALGRGNHPHVYATLSKTVYRTGEDISVRISIACGPNQPCRVLVATIHQCINRHLSPPLAHTAIEFPVKTNPENGVYRTPSGFMQQLSLRPELVCNCGPYSQGGPVPKCEGIAHIPRAVALRILGDTLAVRKECISEGHGFLLAPSGCMLPIVQAFQLPHVSYIVRVRAEYAGPRAPVLQVDVPFVVSSEHLVGLDLFAYEPLPVTNPRSRSVWNPASAASLVHSHSRWSTGSLADAAAALAAHIPANPNAAITGPLGPGGERPPNYSRLPSQSSSLRRPLQRLASRPTSWGSLSSASLPNYDDLVAGGGAGPNAGRGMDDIMRGM